MKKKLVLILLLLVMVSSSGCYFFRSVKTNQVGAKVVKNEIVQCVGPGVYTNPALFRKLYSYSVATLTFEVEDPEVATKDNQLVGVKITIQAKRKGDCESNKAFHTNWSALLKDETLISTIDANAREGIKNGTRQFTLMELLDDRNGLANAIINMLQLDTDKYHTEIVNVTVENISIAPEYADVLQQTAKLKAEEDYQERRQSLIEQQAATDLFEREQQQLVLAEQLKVEQAQTLVDVEIASREGKKTQAAQEIYLVNEKAYTLELIRRLAEVFGEGTTWFLPQDTDLTLLLSGLTGEEQIIPYSSKAGD